MGKSGGEAQAAWEMKAALRAIRMVRIVLISWGRTCEMRRTLVMPKSGRCKMLLGVGLWP